MNKKYIVKNCPCIYTGWRTMYECFYYNKPCIDCTDCLIKQVIKSCKDSLDMGYRDEFISSEILQLFEIEEVDNDR